MAEHEQPEAGWRRFVAEANATGGLTPAPLATTVAPTPLPAGIHTAPQFDPLDLLPPGAADRLLALRQRRDDAHKLNVPFEQVREASMERVSAENALKRLTAHPQEFGLGLKPDHHSVVQAKRTLDKATADFERLKQLQEVRTAAWQAASAAQASVESWLRDGRPHGTLLEQFDGPKPTLNKGETVLDGIERLRRRVRELRADLHRIASAPFPSNYAKAQMRAQIEALAMQGAPSVSRLVEHDGPVDFQTQQLRSQIHNAAAGAIGFTEVPDTVALFAWLHKDALIVALDREIASEADDKSAMSHETRQQREAETMGDLLSIEREEAALIWTAQAQGLPCEFRHDTDPLAILQLRLVTAPRASNGHTSPEHGYNIVEVRR